MNANPNTPKYYRLLEKGETKQAGDGWFDRFNYSVQWNETSEVGLKVTETESLIFLRPMPQVDEWISYAERKPTKEDFEPTGTIECMHNGRPYLSSSFNCDLHDEGYWRSITPPQPAKPKSKRIELVKSNGSTHSITINADGTAKFDCGDVISAESIDAFILAREEVTKKDL